jgi:FkbH-like protein
MIESKVKLVIWDLDETFWRGTLAEEGMTPIERNVGYVQELSKRGIVNSICSKNDYDRARAKLTELGVWEYFVFPRISFNPKGKAVAELIEDAALRPQNVLFIDDNPSNLEEVKFFNPGIMTGHPDDLLEGLLDHPHLAGKPDPEMSRLKQYQFLQRKVDERSTTSLSNEEFLRASNIRITIDYDIESNMDRILELINRTNQLNYTKKRVETPEDVAEFQGYLNKFGFYAGCVHARDSYGDYGLIGFFLGQQRPRKKILIHFVFSCRTMNMGIEQYVYETLNKPEIEIVEPVSYGLHTHDKIDWINIGESTQEGAVTPTNRKLLLLGGCDLLQLASYCSTERLEFVNYAKEGQRLRFDDPNFVLADRELLRECKVIRQFPWWTYEDALKFDEGVASSDLILLSMWPGMNGDYFKTSEGIIVRMGVAMIESLKAKGAGWFERNFEPIEIDDDGRLNMTLASFDTIAAKAGPDARIFCLGCYTLGQKNEMRAGRRKRYNVVAREYCSRRPELFTYVDVDQIVPPDTLVNATHYSRRGTFLLARYILAAFDGAAPDTSASPDAGEEKPALALAGE